MQWLITENRSNDFGWLAVRAYCWSMIFSENRHPLFGIML
jgi:hypothetical protein